MSQRSKCSIHAPTRSSWRHKGSAEAMDGTENEINSLIPTLKAEQDGVSATLRCLQQLVTRPDLRLHAVGTVANNTVTTTTPRLPPHTVSLNRSDPSYMHLMLKCLPAGRKPRSARSLVMISKVSAVTSSSLVCWRVSQVRTKGTRYPPHQRKGGAQPDLFSSCSPSCPPLTMMVCIVIVVAPRTPLKPLRKRVARVDPGQRAPVERV